MKDLKERGAALVIVGHRPSTLAEADRILVLKEGRVVLFGPRDEILKSLRTNALSAVRDEDEPLPATEADDKPDSLRERLDRLSPQPRLGREFGTEAGA